MSAIVGPGGGNVNAYDVYLGNEPPVDSSNSNNNPGAYDSYVGSGNTGESNPNAYDSHPGDSVDVTSDNNNNPGAYDAWIKA